jgi:adenylate cyclase
MNPSFKLSRTHLAAAAGAVLAVGCGLFVHEFRLGSALINSSYDLLHVFRGDIQTYNVVMVYMDESSYEKLGQSWNAPWDRSLHAKLINRLTAAGARAIVFDITFTDPIPGNPAGDEAMANAAKQSGRVIVAVDDVMSAATGVRAKNIKPPFDLLRTNIADIGSDELQADADVNVRKHTSQGDNPLPALSWAVAAFESANSTQTPGAENMARWMNYYGPPNSIPHVSYYEALDPSLAPDPLFNNKTVFVGSRTLTKFAGERKDEYSNPFSSFLSDEMIKQQGAMFIPGVEIQATAFLNLLRGDWLRRASWGAEQLVLVLAGLLSGFGLVLLKPWKAAVGALVATVLAIAVSCFLFSNQRHWFPWLIVVLQISVALAWSILFNSVQLYVQNRLYEQTLSHYLPPKLVKKYAKSRELLRGSENKTLTLLFSDIESFTTLTEGMRPEELESMMNQYFQVAVALCIHPADGTVSKFIGDAIFAFWNAPDAQEDHALLACRAALAFGEEAAKPINGRLLRTRIGLHTAHANVGNFGSEDRFDYTALGENVNLASRLEGLNKHLGTRCLMSAATKKAIGDQLVTRGLGKFQLKGFEGLVEVHELIGLPDQAENSRSWREAFAEALANYEDRNLEFAKLGFERVLELKPDDGPSKFYLERIADLSRQELPDNWSTHTILKEK